jgi:hypothetical protein
MCRRRVPIGFNAPLVGFGVVVAATIASAAPDTGSVKADRSGIYYVAIGMDPLFKIELAGGGGSVSFLLTGGGIALEGTGTMSGRTMTLVSDLGGGEEFTAGVVFTPDDHEFEGTWEVVGGNPGQGTITGTRNPWPEYDIGLYGTPRFVSADCIELGKIWKVSKFRSGMGHDYSDDLESCRSMKHYFLPRESVDPQSVKLYSPVTGTVIGSTDEWDGPDVWKGTAIGIRPDGHDAFWIVLFHVNLNAAFEVGDRVSAGQLIGTSQKTSGTVTDMAVAVHTPHGYRLISYFEVASEGVFARYVARGARTRTDFTFTEAERDADPLSCNGQQFADPGNLENWVTLEEGTRRHRGAARHTAGRDESAARISDFPGR